MFRAIIAVAPLLCLGVYIIFCAAYCYKKGQIGWKGPRIVDRKEDPISFIVVVIWIGAGGLAFVIYAIYSLAHWPSAR